MKIEFDTQGITPTEARGLINLLQALAGSTAVTGTYVVNMAGPAVDGYPSEPQPPADNDHVAEGATPFPEPQSDTPASGLDTAGIPWDERIHASTKTTNKDGTWTRRRNTPDETFDAVMAELKGVKTNLYGNTDKGGVGPDGMVSIPTPPAAEPSASEAFAPAAPPAPASVTIPAAPVPPAPAATGDAPSFVDLMKKITTLQGAGKLTKPDLDGYLQSCGVEGVGKLATASADARSNVGAILDSLS